MSLNLATMLRESAVAHPNKPVALYDGGRLSYAELDALSDRFAAGLSASAWPGGQGRAAAAEYSPVPHRLLRHAQGRVCRVPLNVLLKAPEIAYRLSDSGARALITWAGVADQAKGAPARPRSRGLRRETPGVPESPVGRRFEGLLAPSPDAADGADRPGRHGGHRLYLGNYGNPKGAELTHFQLFMNADTPGRLFGIRDDDVVLVVLPLFHVFGLSSQLNVCVRFGVTMYLMPRFDAGQGPGGDTAGAHHDIRGRSHHVRRSPQPPPSREYDVSSLRVGVSGGAALPAEVLDDFERKFGIVILEGYGLSETASTTSFNVSADERKIYSVGKPIWGVEVEIWDEENRPLPLGPDHVGELVIRGVNTMQ